MAISPPYFAPSILDHIDDLIEGLKDKVYKVIDGALVYSSTWWQRQKVRSGKSVMDEYGDIL